MAVREIHLANRPSAVDGDRHTGELPPVVLETHGLLTAPLVRAFSHRSRLGLSIAPPFGIRSASLALPTPWPTMPSADFCPAVRLPLKASVVEATPNRSPGVSSAAFRAQSPDLRFAPLMDMDFAVRCPLVRHGRLVSGSCPSTRTFAPRFLQTSPRGDSPCGSLTLHLHQVGMGTCTPRVAEHARHTKCRPGAAPQGKGKGVKGLRGNFPGTTEPNIVVPVLRTVPEAVRRAQELRIVDPRPAPQNPQLTCRRPFMVAGR